MEFVVFSFVVGEYMRDRPRRFGKEPFEREAFSLEQVKTEEGTFTATSHQAACQLARCYLGYGYGRTLGYLWKKKKVGVIAVRSESIEKVNRLHGQRISTTQIFRLMFDDEHEWQREQDRPIAQRKKSEARTPEQQDGFIQPTFF